MDEPDSYITQQTPPPSPYLETAWDLPIGDVHEGLLHPKEKRRGYLELYFAGFMEFADSPPSPDISDDETEYPRWGKLTSAREQSRSSNSIAEAPQSPETSTFSDSSEIIHPLSQRTSTASTDSTDFSVYESSQRQLTHGILHPNAPLIRTQKQKRKFIRRIPSGYGRIAKAHRRSCSSTRTRSATMNKRPILRSHSTSSTRRNIGSKG